MPSWFPPVFELCVVSLVLCYVAKNYFAQRNALNALEFILSTERKALKDANTALEAARRENQAPESRVATLKNALTIGTLVEKRALVIERNTRRLPDATLAHEVTHTFDEARFWTGAFTFIGLCGTLLCLGVAVFYLMLIVGRSNTSATVTSGLKDVVAHMVAVFGGMGAAFFSTAGGVLATLKLAGKMSSVEGDWEKLRADLDEFSLLELEPLASAMHEQDEDLSRLEKIVARMESVASFFVDGMEKTLTSVRQLDEANDSLRVKLQSAAQTLDGAAVGLSTAADGLGGNLTALAASITQQHDDQKAWQQSAGETLQWLHEAVGGARETFADLHNLQVELSRDNAQTRAEMRESLQGVQAFAQNIGQTSQQTFYQLSETIKAGLQSIKDSVQAGVDGEAELLKRFEAILTLMGDYASHVEDTLRSLPGAIGSEPIITMENHHAQALEQVSSHLGHVRGEIVGLRGDVRDNLGEGLKEALRGSLAGTGQQLKEVSGKVDSLGAQVRGASNTDGLKNMQDNIAGLTAQVSAMGTQMQRIQSAVGRLDKSFVIRIGGKGE